VTRTQRQIEEHRQGDCRVEVHNLAGRPVAGVSVWVEQESHAFVFGCVAPDLAALVEADRQRCAARLEELFNLILSPHQPPDPRAVQVDVPDGVPLATVRRELDRLAATGRPLDVHVRGRCGGMESTGEAERVAELYTLCFAHPAVRGLVWNGFWDGEPGVAGRGLLRLDFSPRPAFRYLLKLLGDVWHSRASGMTDEEGRFRFRGFFGAYRVGVRVGEEAATTAVLDHRVGEEAARRLQVG
jgi:hypothetical protein